jgi:hypothetical protein
LTGRWRPGRRGKPTMTSPGEAARKAAAAYNAAADHYDDPSNSFWDRYGRDGVARLSLTPGAHIFDACCGSGASALPAAHAVGPSGSVLGIDLAENLLDLARAKAKNRGLENVAFRVGDILNLSLPSASFHAVVCVFGIFSCLTWIAPYGSFGGRDAFGASVVPQDTGRSCCAAEMFCLGRVEDGRGSLGPMASAPFPIPAHQTERADFRHSAFRLASPQGPRWSAARCGCPAMTPRHVTYLRLAV